MIKWHTYAQSFEGGALGKMLCNILERVLLQVYTDKPLEELVQNGGTPTGGGDHLEANDFREEANAKARYTVVLLQDPPRRIALGLRSGRD